MKNGAGLPDSTTDQYLSAMAKIKISDLCAATGARFVGPQALADSTVCNALTDSRSLVTPDGTVFFALKTARADGHDYIEELYNAGVRFFVIDNRFDPTPWSDAVFLMVNDTLHALQAGAMLIRQRFNRPLIAITGSRGKTVVKEMLYGALAPHMRIARSPRSYNSHIGVPLSLWQIEPDSQLGIFEAGISGTGEMPVLQEMLHPEIGIFTALTAEHTRGFADDAEKCREKALLFKGCRRIIYDSSNPIIADTLTQMYPDTVLTPCDSYADMCIAAAGCLDITLAPGQLPAAVQSRIDITDSADNATLAYDYFTCDLSGIETALDTVRRRSAPGRPLNVVLGDILCDAADKDMAYSRLETLLTLFDVSAVFAAGPEISERVARFTSGVAAHLCPGGPAEVVRYLSSRPHLIYNTTVYINGTDKRHFRQIYTWLSTRGNVTRLEVNLDSLAANFRHYRSQLPPQTGLIGMIKAAGYGCGDLEVARTLQSIGADMVAVAVVDEGVALRQGGVTLPVMVLDPWCEDMRAIFANNLQPTIIDCSRDMLGRLEHNADSEGVHDIYVHLKLDTGMHRVGLREEDMDSFTGLLKQHPRIHLASMFSHLATADCLDLDSYTTGQLNLFERMTRRIIAGLGYDVPRHILNTAGITRYGRTHVYDFARLGIGLYGISPLDAADNAALVPVARLVTRIIALNSYPAGTTIGYGCRGVLSRPSVIATIPVGYADGIDRHLGNGNASFLVNGTMCPTVGNICMDLCMIDVTDCHTAVGDEVEIFGPDAPIQRLSDALGTIPYEVLARVSPRVKRVYYRE